VHNTVTGRRFEILHGPDGRRLITAVDSQPTDPDVMGNLAHSGNIQYEIRDGHYIVEMAGTPIEVTVYKLGDRYVAARSSEFGFANYEIEPVAE